MGVHVPCSETLRMNWGYNLDSAQRTTSVHNFYHKMYTLFSASLLTSTGVLMCIGLVNAQTFTSTRRIVGLVFGILSFVVGLIGLALCCLKLYLIRKRRKALRSQAQQVTRHLSVTTGHHVTYSLYLPSTVNSSSEATNTFMGVPHSRVPLESELQNAPPPAYSAAHQYPACTEPDEATSQKKDTFYGEEPTAEPPPSYPE